jgi:hypothetical protein
MMMGQINLFFSINLDWMHRAPEEAAPQNAKASLPFLSKSVGRNQMPANNLKSIQQKIHGLLGNATAPHRFLLLLS